MSIRIHALALKIGMDNKELLALLKERKFDVKSVSSTVDNISAEALEKEFAGKFPGAETAAPAPSPVAPPVADVPSAVPQVRPPPGMFVKSAQDIVREKEAAAVAKAAAKPAAVAPAPSSAPRPVSP